MKILAPVNNAREVEAIIRHGADEIYCGLIPPEWKRNYTNVASPNRREWMTANLSGFDELKKAVDVAHGKDVPVYLTLNAFYTRQQYPLLFQQIEYAEHIGIDAFIVADVGLLLALNRKDIKAQIHISTGGTTFNSETAMFYRKLGADRIVFPRHLRIEEMEEIVRNCPGLKFEAFILNSGCKNVDGFCTFQHGINELFYGNRWNIPKRLNLDRYLLNMVRRLPERLSRSIKGDIFGIDSACLLNYKISYEAIPAGINQRVLKNVLKNIGRNFSLLSGADTCGACRLPDFKRIGIHGVKIVGRNYSTAKKIQDVRFLKTTLSSLETEDFDREEFSRHAKEIFKRIYGMKCRSLCYYPDDERAVRKSYY